MLLNGVESNFLLPSLGVPQGSILSPFFSLGYPQYNGNFCLDCIFARKLRYSQKSGYNIPFPVLQKVLLVLYQNSLKFLIFSTLQSQHKWTNIYIKRF